MTAPRLLPRRRFDRSLALVSLVIAVGLVLIGYAFVRSVSSDEQNRLPDEIERVTPVPDAVQVLAQTQVIVDLEEGYEGRLTIDGVEFETQRLGGRPSGEPAEPGTQVEVPPGVIFEPGNATLTFTPGPGVGFDRFSEGNHIARVTYWSVEQGEGTARSFTWTFNVL